MTWKDNEFIQYLAEANRQLALAHGAAYRCGHPREIDRQQDIEHIQNEVLVLIRDYCDEHIHD